MEIDSSLGISALSGISNSIIAELGGDPIAMKNFLGEAISQKLRVQKRVFDT